MQNIVGHSVENTKIYCQTQRKNRENVDFTEFFAQCVEKIFRISTLCWQHWLSFYLPLFAQFHLDPLEGIMLLPIRGWNGDLCANFAPLCLDRNGFESLKIVYLVSKAQCGNFIIFLSLKFYVKSILRILKVQNLPL